MYLVFLLVRLISRAEALGARFEHRLATSDTLASVMLLQSQRMSVWRFEHRLATSDTLASVMFAQPVRSSD